MTCTLCGKKLKPGGYCTIDTKLICNPCYFEFAKWIDSKEALLEYKRLKNER